MVTPPMGGVAMIERCLDGCNKVSLLVRFFIYCVILYNYLPVPAVSLAHKSFTICISTSKERSVTSFQNSSYFSW